MIRTPAVPAPGSAGSPGTRGGNLSRHGVDVWQMDLRLAGSDAGRLAGYLSDDERERAGRFHFEEDRMRAILVRGTLRELLGEYAAMHPRELRFVYGHNGKPRLENGSRSDITFNLSHSGSIAVFAVSRNRLVGIDVERIRPDLQAEQIAGRMFAPGEITVLRSAHPLERMDLFFQYWTRKEAFVKVTGDGISFPLDHCDVSGSDGGRLAPVTLLDHQSGPIRWYVQDLPADRGYAAAIAVEGCDWSLSYRRIP